MNLLLITEKDLEDGELQTIGIADTREKAFEMIKQYYGRYETIKTYHTENPNLEAWFKIKCPNLKDEMVDECIITIENFRLNEV